MRARCLQGTRELLRHGCCSHQLGREQKGRGKLQQRVTEAWGEGIADQRWAGAWSGRPGKPSSGVMNSNYHPWISYTCQALCQAIGIHLSSLWYLLWQRSGNGYLEQWNKLPQNAQWWSQNSIVYKHFGLAHVVKGRPAEAIVKFIPPAK